VDTARTQLERGERPTIAGVAEEALLSRPTVYRYFPTQESLLQELNVSLAVSDMEALLAGQSEATPPGDRVLELVDRSASHISELEVLYRTSVRHYMDLWLAAEASGAGHAQEVREGRRRRWIETALGSALDDLPAGERARLVSALCLVVGAESLIVMRDVCRLEDDDAIAVLHWAAEAILAAGLPGS
jgi:AcrR family transcriptional regulator